MLPRINRLTKNKDFEAVFKKGKSFKEDFLVLKFIANKNKNCRFGFVVSGKISKRATIRNKIKRRMSAAIKSIIPEIKKGTDIVLLALSGIETKDFREIEETTNNIFKKAKLLENV